MIQTNFMGASISTFDVSMGWNGQSTTLSVVLAEDPLLNETFIPVNPGTPSYFSYNGWSFGGIFRSYIRDHSVQGNVIKLDIGGPEEILSCVKLIISGYSGAINLKNLYNIYGYWENQGFGASQLNEQGMPFIKILDAINILTEDTSDYGTIMEFRGTQFHLDLSEIPIPSSDYRVSGVSIGLLDFISQVCADTSHDFFFTLRQLNGRNVITLKTVARNINPVRGRIDAFISSTLGASVISKGLELRNETTSKFLVGDQVLDLNVSHNNFADNDWRSASFRFSEGFENYNGRPIVLNYQYQARPGNSNTGRFIFPLNFPPLNELTELTNGEIWPFWGTDILGFTYLRGRAQEEKDWITYLEDSFSNIIVDPDSNIGELPENAKPLLGGIIRPIGRADVSVGRSAIAALAWYHDEHYFPSTVPGYPYFITIGELRAAAVSQDAWENYVQARSTAYKMAHDNWFSNVFVGGFDELYGRHIDYYQNPDTLQIYTNYGLTRAEEIGITSNFSYDVDLLNKILGNVQITEKDINNITKQAMLGSAKESGRRAKLERIYQNIHNIASTYYGRKFMVKLNDLSVRLNDELLPVYSDDPSQDGYFEGDVLGLNQLQQLFFKNQEGKIDAFIEFDSVDFIDLTKMDSKDYFIVDKATGVLYNNLSTIDDTFNGVGNTSFGYHARLYLRCQIEPNVIFRDYILNLVALGASENDLTISDARLIITLPYPVFFRKESIIQPRVTGVGENRSGITYGNLLYPAVGFGMETYLGVVLGQSHTPEQKASIEATITSALSKVYGEDILPQCLVPRACAYGLRSNTRRYEPWYASGGIGKVEFETEANLNPWTFNGFTNMNNAGLARVINAVSHMQETEIGSVEVPGSPTISMGDPLITGGPIVTDVSLRTGSQNVSTVYSMRTSQPNYDGISRQLYSTIEKNTRKTFFNTKNEKVVERFFAQENNPLYISDKKRLDKKIGTPHGMLIGEIIEGSSIVLASSGNTINFYNTNVGTENIFEFRPELNNNYVNLGGVSMDAIFRPYSTSPSGSTVINSSGQITTVPNQFLPRFVSPAEGAESPTVNDLNPFKVGHDITYAIRGSTLPNDLRVSGVPTDVRGMALKAPVVIGGWGYNVAGSSVGTVGDPSTWKVGPLDTRWDESRGVWSTGGSSSNGLLRGVSLETILPNDSGRITLIDMASGNDVSASSWLGQPVCSGQNLFVSRVNLLNGLSAYYIVISQFSSINVVSSLDCSGDVPVVGRKTIYLPSAYQEVCSCSGV